MLRKALEYFAQKKNASFRLDKRVGNGVLFSFLSENGIALLRGIFTQLLHARKPVALFLKRRVSISGMKSFYFGKNVRIGNDVQLIAWSEHGLHIGKNSWIGGHSFIKASFSFNEIGKGIHIGNNVGIGEFAHLGGAGGLSIGDDCIIGPYFSCHPENHAFLDDHQLIRLQGTTRKGISIGNNCWIGAKVTILDGVTIGDNCIVAAGAVVSKDIPGNAVVAGVPAKVIRIRNTSNENNIRVA